MKHCFFEYPKGLYEALTAIHYESQPLVVKEYADAEDQPPYVQILNMSSTFERDDDTFSQNVYTDIMVTTSHIGSPGQFGSKQSNDIMNLIMQKLITKGVTVDDRAAHIVMTNFTDNGCYFAGLSYINNYDGHKITVMEVLTISTHIDEK